MHDAGIGDDGACQGGREPWLRRGVPAGLDLGAHDLWREVGQPVEGGIRTVGWRTLPEPATGAAAFHIRDERDFKRISHTVPLMEKREAPALEAVGDDVARAADRVDRGFIAPALAIRMYAVENRRPRARNIVYEIRRPVVEDQRSHDQRRVLVVRHLLVHACADLVRAEIGIETEVVDVHVRRRADIYLEEKVFAAELEKREARPVTRPLPRPDV